MIRWPWKKPAPHAPVPPDDVGEAQKLREEARQEHHEAIQTGYAVSQLTAYIAERRALNHFGESIQITFTRRANG